MSAPRKKRAARGKIRLPFTVRIYDDDPAAPHGKEFGPVWLEIPAPATPRYHPVRCAAPHWELLSREESAGRRDVVRNLEVSVDFEAFMKK